MNADPYIPLPKQNENEPLVFEQLIMLWFVWVSGLAVGLIAFFGELVAAKRAKHIKRITGPRQTQDITLHPKAGPQSPNPTASITELE